MVQFAPAQFALVQFALKEPIEYSKNGELNVTLEFGHVTLPEESTGMYSGGSSYARLQRHVARADAARAR